jgi:hypothetical protein
MIKYNSSIFIILSLILLSWVLISCEEKDHSEIIKQIEIFENTVNENKEKITINLDAIGSWDNGKINDKGEIEFSDGRVYSGEWIDGKPNGTGKITIPDLDYVSYMIIEDNQESNNKNGTREITINYDSVVSYEGEWVDGKRHGFGKTTWWSENYYKGEYINGFRDGKGLLKGEDWGEYVGEWKNNRIHGSGTITFLDGEKWIGDFKKGKISNIIVRDKDGDNLEGFLFGFFPHKRSLLEPLGMSEYEVKAAIGENIIIDNFYEMEDSTFMQSQL